MRKQLVMLAGIVLSVTVLVSKVVCAQSPEDYLLVEDELRLFYRVVGHGDETVVICPAAGWGIENFERLAQNRTIIFYDPRSRGRSDVVKDASRIGIDHDVRDLEAVRRYFNRRKITIIGWSNYGAVAARYALKYPNRVDRLIQIETLAPAYDIEINGNEIKEIIPADSAAIKRRDEMLKMGIDKTDPEIYCKAYYAALLPAFVGDTTVMKQIRVPCIYPNEWPQNVNRTLLYFAESLGNWNWRTEVTSLKMPTLVIHGEKDRITLLKGSRIWASRPNARLLIIPGAGHFPFVERPDILFPALESFLQGSWPEDTRVVKSYNELEGR